MRFPNAFGYSECLSVFGVLVFMCVGCFDEYILGISAMGACYASYVRSCALAYAAYAVHRFE